MADRILRDNKQRVRPAGLVARATTSFLDHGALHAAVALVAWWSGLLGQLAAPSAEVAPHRAALLAALLVVAVVVISAASDLSVTSPGRRLFATRVVDARSYRRIGVVRTVLRRSLRDAQIVVALGLTYAPMLERAPADDLRRAGWYAGWVAACYALPLAVAFVMPRSRAPHDWLCHTVVIEAEEFSRRPVVRTEVLSPAELRGSRLV